MAEEGNKEVYSQHIFLYPFILRGENDWFKHHCLESDVTKWKKWKNHSKSESAAEAANEFMVGQYFNKETRDLFHNEDKDNCIRYYYDKDVVEQSRYLISDKGEDYYGRLFEYRYELPVEGIELFVFHGKIGILKIAVKYTKSEESTEIEKRTDDERIRDIKRINDFGRRIILPFIPREDSGEFLPDKPLICAGRLGLKLGEDEHFVKDFRGDIAKWEKCSDKDYQAPDFLYALLAGAYGGEYKDGSDGAKRINKLKCPVINGKKHEEGMIQSVIDDRMYLCSVICLNKLSAIAKKWNRIQDATEKVPELQDATEEVPESQDVKDNKLIYSLVFADEGDPSCQNSLMRNALLKKAIYPRWSNYGTLHSISNSAFLCMTEQGAPEGIVVRPFLTEYYLIAVLVLAQKVSLTNFSELASEASEDMKKSRGESIERVIQLQEEYVAWENQECLLEVTEQEQGVEIYHLLQGQLGVMAHYDRLKEQLQGLYAVANVRQGDRLNQQGRELSRKGAVVASIAAVWAVCAIIVDITLNTPNFISPDFQDVKFGLPGILMIVVLVVVWVLGIRFTRNLLSERFKDLL